MSGIVLAGGGPAGRVVIETAEGITVYPARREGDRWRASWYEEGRRRQCQAASEAQLAARLVKVAERLTADAPNLLRTGNQLIAYYLSPDRRPAEKQWSRKHADTQSRLCSRYLQPVIGHLTCQDIKAAHMQAAVNAAPTAKEGRRVRAMISALAGAGITGGYMVNSRLKEVHWQACGRPVVPPRAVPAGESVLFVDPGEIPADEDVARLGQALTTARPLYQLMVNFAAYSGLRWGELIGLTIGQISRADRVVAVDRKVVEVRGHLFLEAPKNRKWRRTIYPRTTPAGWPLAEMVAARIDEVQWEQAAGRNPLGLMFSAPAGGYWRASNFSRRVLKPAYLAVGWRGSGKTGGWTWHSLRHVFCTTALNTWRMDASDVSRLAGHANIRITLEMYVGNTAGTLHRACAATD
jgi:integrase